MANFTDITKNLRWFWAVSEVDWVVMGFGGVLMGKAFG
jgi:hypothetical protein|tara:strand:- start:29 stop:142 length:114 start_codon:yes stop_codon:yes gene_type:complete